MLVSIRKLLYGDAKKVGNHKLEVVNDGNRIIKKFIYFQTAICTAIPCEKRYRINNGGWNTKSTNRVINDYVRHFEALGYTRF